MFARSPMLAFSTTASAGIVRPQDVIQILTRPANQMQAAIGTLPFSPDILFDKDRVATTDWSVRNSLRGFDKTLACNTPAAEVAWPGYSGSNNRVVLALKQQARVAARIYWEGDGVNGRIIPHPLEIPPGLVIVKRLDASSPWPISHRTANFGLLNGTDAYTNQLSAQPTTNGYTANFSSTSFSLQSGSTGISAVNAAGGLYIAILLAHDTDPNGLVQCGVFTTDDNAAASIPIGWPPLAAIIKSTSVPGNYTFLDTVRGWKAGNDALLYPNLTAVESVAADVGAPNAVGFDSTISPNRTYMYAVFRAPIT